MEDLFENGTEGDVVGVSGEDEGQTRRQEFQIGSIGEGPFSVFEGSCLQGAPVEGLGPPSEGRVDRGHDGGDVRQETIVVVDHANEFLQRLHCVGRGKGTNSSSLFL